MNSVKFLRTTFLQNTSGQLLVYCVFTDSVPAYCTVPVSGELLIQLCYTNTIASYCFIVKAVRLKEFLRFLIILGRISRENACAYISFFVELAGGLQLH